MFPTSAPFSFLPMMYGNSNFQVVHICLSVVAATPAGVLCLTVALMHVSLVAKGIGYLVPIAVCVSSLKNASLNYLLLNTLLYAELSCMYVLSQLDVVQLFLPT